ncbi:MAG: MarR family transcriptional regulator, partial [ANME-2 cluster archaeon]
FYLFSTKTGQIRLPEPEAPEESEEPGELEELEHGDAESAIPSDLQEVLSIIREHEGRITQKDLRMRLNCSEAKASLMVTDLEDRGLVKKVKRGRGNVIILTDL